MVGHDPQWWLENLVEREDRLRALSEASKKCSRLCEPRFTGARPLLRRPAALYADVSSSRCGAAWRNSGALALGSADRCLHLITRASTLDPCLEVLNGIDSPMFGILEGDSDYRSPP
jgi:hypothetical protein